MADSSSLLITVQVDTNQANKALSGVNNSLTVIENQSAATAKRWGNNFDNMADSSSRSMANARGAAMLLERQIGIQLPRAVNTFLSRSQLIGPALAAAFSVSVYTAIAAAIYQAGKSIWDWAIGAKEIKERTEEIEKTTVKWAEHTIALKNELGLIGSGGLTKLRIEVGQTADSLSRAKDEAGKLRSEFEKILATPRQTKLTSGTWSPYLALFGTSDKEVQDAGEKYQEAQDKVRAAQTKFIEAQAARDNQIESKRIELSMTEIDAQEKIASIRKEGLAEWSTELTNAKLLSDYAAITVKMKKEEQVKTEALANNMLALAQGSEEALVSDRQRLGIVEAQLKVSKSLAEANRETNRIPLLETVPESTWKKIFSETETGVSYTPLPGGIDELVRQTGDWLDQTASQMDAAEKMNLETAKMATNEKLKQLSAEESMASKIQAITPQAKMLMEERKADVDYQIEGQKIQLEYELELIDLEKYRRDLLKTSTIGETPDIVAAVAARKAQIEKNKDSELATAGLKRDKDVQDAQTSYALQKIETIRDAAGHIFDDMLSGSQNIWKDLLRSFENIFLSPVRIMFQNLAQYLFGGLRMPGIGGAAAAGGAALGALPGISGSGGGLSSIFGGSGGSGTGLSGLGSMGLGAAGLSGWALPVIGGMLTAGSMIPNKAAKGGIYAATGLAGISALGAAGVGSFAAIASSLTIPVIGAIIGAGIGIGYLIGHFLKSAREKVREKVKATYGVDIKDKGIQQQIVDLAKSSYGGNLDSAIRSADVAELVRLYAMTTGQTTGGLPAQMTASSLAQSGGILYQQTSYSNGLPTANLGGSLQSSGGLNVTINLSPEAAQNLLTQGVLRTIGDNPRAVQSSSMQATRSNFNRRELTAMQLAPGTLTS
jgi:hypothetical protein